MSDSDGSDLKEIIEQQNSSNPSSEDSASKREISTESEIVIQVTGNLTTSDHDHEKDLNVEEEELNKPNFSSKEYEEFTNDGFKTPTAPSNKIPAIIECPPAPKKIWPPPSTSKRKASPPPTIFPLDEQSDIDSIFRPITSEDTLEDKKVKKARTDDEG